MTRTAPCLERRLALTTSAAHEAREVVRRELADDLEAEVVGDLMLVVSELVTDSVRRGAAGIGGTITLRLSRDDRLLRVEVENGGSVSIGQEGDPRETVSGFGLSLVATVSHRWGLESGRTGRTTIAWAELAT